MADQSQERRQAAPHETSSAARAGQEPSRELVSEAGGESRTGEEGQAAKGQAARRAPTRRRARKRRRRRPCGSGRVPRRRRASRLRRRSRDPRRGPSSRLAGSTGAGPSKIGLMNCLRTKCMASSTNPVARASVTAKPRAVSGCEQAARGGLSVLRDLHARAQAGERGSLVPGELGHRDHSSLRDRFVGSHGRSV